MIDFFFYHLTLHIFFSYSSTHGVGMTITNRQQLTADEIEAIQLMLRTLLVGTFNDVSLFQFVF